MHSNLRVDVGRRASGPAARRPGHVDARLPGGGRVALRPLRQGEAAPLLTVVSEMSAASRASRYFTGISRLPASMVRALVDVDGRRHVAWVAEIEDRPVGIARYVLAAPGTAEIALEVVDRHHGAGLGTLLADVVTTVAAAQGVRRVRAAVLPDNEPSRRVVARLGVRLALVDGLLEGEGDLRLLDPPRVDRGAVVALACRAAALDDEECGALARSAQ